MPNPVRFNHPLSPGLQPSDVNRADHHVHHGTGPQISVDGLDLSGVAASGVLQTFEALMLTAAKCPRASTLPGSEALLNRRELKRLQAGMGTWSECLKTRLKKLLGGFGGSTAPFAQGLLLRAMAARVGRLGQHRDALEEVYAFAGSLKGLSPAELEKRATVLDLDPLENTSHIDALRFWDRRGVIHDRTKDDVDSNNDGLFQRFTASCGPTVIQMMLAEADPVVAFAVHGSGIHSTSDNDTTADFQKTLLERFEGIAVGRQQASIRSRLKNALGRLRRYGHITPAQSMALLDYCEGQQGFNGLAKQALKALRKDYRGFPAKAQIKILRGGSASKDAGMTTAGFVEALNETMAPLTGATYAITSPPNGFERGEARHYIDAVVKALSAGHDVPLGMQEPAHWLLLSAVKGRGARRQFLVSDPDGGRTAWVKEKDLLSGHFAEAQFYLCTQGQNPYVDAFVLPV